MTRPVLTKPDFVQRYARGEFGNCVPTWHSVCDMLADHYRGLVHIRNRVIASQTWYNVWSWNVPLAVNTIKEKYGIPEHYLYFSAMAPHYAGTIQGEVMRGPWLYYLTWTHAKQPMRYALSQETHYAEGMNAKHLLDANLNPNSREWLEHLLDTYQDHVVEFTCFSIEFGTVPGHNTIFWEVRKY